MLLQPFSITFIDFEGGLDLLSNPPQALSRKLFPGGEMLAITVSVRLFYDFFKTISGNEVEKLRIYAIVIHRSGLSC